MPGELWQECERRGCRNEPVCVDCFLCERHCTCPSAEERAEIEARGRSECERRRNAALAVRAAAVAAMDAGTDPCTIPLKRHSGAGFVIGSPWMDETDPPSVAWLLDAVLAREERLAPHEKREPMTTRADVIRYLAANREIKYGADWYENIRLAGGAPEDH